MKTSQNARTMVLTSVPGFGPGDRDPIRRHPTFVQPVVHQLKIFAGVDVRGPRCAGRRRFSRDQIEQIPRCLQKDAAILDVQARAWIVEGMLVGRVDSVAHRHDVGRQFHDVDCFDGRQIQDRCRRDARAVADDQRPSQRPFVHQHRPVREVAHVAERGNGGARHREAVGHDPVVNRLAQPSLLHQKDRFRRAFARRDDRGAIARVRTGDACEVPSRPSGRMESRRATAQARYPIRPTALVSPCAEVHRSPWRERRSLRRVPRCRRSIVPSQAMAAAQTPRSARRTWRRLY